MVAQTSFPVGGNNYQASKLPAFDQMAIARRLMPAIKTLLTPEVMASIAQSRQADGKLDFSRIDLSQMIPAMADAIYSLSDDDAERIVRTSLKVVQRQNAEGTVWSPVMTPQGQVMFDDIDLPVMLQIAWNVIEAQLGSFFSTAR